MYSLVVSGSVASSIVLSTSTNGTCATTALNRSGRMLLDRAHQHAAGAAALNHQPILDVYFCAIRCSAEAMKSVNVFILFIMRPASRHGSPSSPPPRMCAMA